MRDTLSHRGLTGSVEYSAEDKVLYGQVLGIRGLISYEGNSIAELEASFHEAVDDFLADVDAGTVSLTVTDPWQITIQPDMAERAMRYAQAHDLEVGSLVEKALDRFMETAA